eukprot:Clim_evm97s236 gene=Clim_evmTU97s236
MGKRDRWKTSLQQTVKQKQETNRYKETTSCARESTESTDGTKTVNELLDELRRKQQEPVRVTDHNSTGTGSSNTTIVNSRHEATLRSQNQSQDTNSASQCLSLGFHEADSGGRLQTLMAQRRRQVSGPIPRTWLVDMQNGTRRHLRSVPVRCRGIKPHPYFGSSSLAGRVCDTGIMGFPDELSLQTMAAAALARYIATDPTLLTEVSAEYPYGTFMLPVIDQLLKQSLLSDDLCPLVAGLFSERASLVGSSITERGMIALFPSAVVDKRLGSLRSNIGHQTETKRSDCDACHASGVQALGPTMENWEDYLQEGEDHEEEDVNEALFEHHEWDDDDEEDEEPLVPAANFLEHLLYPRSVVPRGLQCLPSTINALDLSFCGSLQGGRDMIYILSNNLPSITELRIAGCFSEITGPPTVSAIMTMMEHLRILDLSCSYWLNLRDLRPLLVSGGYLTDLKVLDLCHCPLIKEENIYAIRSRRGPRLMVNVERSVWDARHVSIRNNDLGTYTATATTT